MAGYQDVVSFWKSKHIRSSAELDEMLNTTKIALAYHSGKLENDNITYHDTREIFEHDSVTAYTGDLRTLFEIGNAKRAYEQLLQWFDVKPEIDTSLIRQLHFFLTNGTYDERRWQLGERPGEFKKHDYVTGKEEVGALPEDVEEELAELCDELRDLSESEAFTAACYFHVKFENIHPFADGNGRVGRLLLNYILLLHDLPPVVIHEEDRKAYYDALEAWDTDQVLAPMQQFLEAQTVKTWEKRMERNSQ